jgi:hypothetical protein
MLPTRFEPIQPLDPDQPLQALSLPPWVQRCLKDLTADYMNPEISAELALSDAQRAAVEARIEDLEAAEIACDVDNSMAVLAGLVEAFASARLTDEQARARAKGYMTALEGMPTWAVAEAARRWLRAECGPQNYDFAPSPPRICQICKDVLAELGAQRHVLQKLLRARVPQITSPEERQRINEGFGALLSTLKYGVQRQDEEVLKTAAVKGDDQCAAE